MNITKVNTIEEALALLSKGAKVLAGGTNLYVNFKKKGYPEDSFIDISGLEELEGIRLDGEKHIGALVTFAELLREEEESALCQAAREMGSPQIRSRATLGGNVCDSSPACDAGPVLLVYEAKALLCSADGRREVAMTDFFRGYRQTAKRSDELLTEFILPDEKGKSVFRKVGLRNAMAISVVSLAAKESGGSIRLAMGSVAEIPVRLTHCEALTKEKKIDRESLRAALSLDIRPISDIRASREYRFETAQRLLCDLLEKEYGYEIL